MFFIKKSKIHVDAFCAIPGVSEYFPIKKASEFLPKWWKELPSSIPQVAQNGVEGRIGTIKRCDGVIDMYRTGFIIPLWSELQINTTAMGEANYVSSGSSIINHEHPREQLGYAFNDYIHFKIVSPWFFKEKTGVKFMWQRPDWNMVQHLHNVSVAPGVLEYKYQHSTNINLFLPRRDAKIRLASGTPIVHVTPLSEKEVVVKCHLITQEEYTKTIEPSRYPVSYLGAYKKKKKIMQENEKKCPFGFGK